MYQFYSISCFCGILFCDSGLRFNAISLLRQDQMSLDGETSSLVNAIDVTHDIYDSAHMIIETAKARSAVKSMHSRPLLTLYLAGMCTKF
jgi:hypothetical protein